LDDAGKLLAASPWGQQAVDLQRALAKVLTTSLSLQPPVPSTAVHALEVLIDTESKARRVPGPQGQQFITFDDTFVIYSELLAHRMGVPLPHFTAFAASIGNAFAATLLLASCKQLHIVVLCGCCWAYLSAIVHLYCWAEVALFLLCVVCTVNKVFCLFFGWLHR
jgi:hypothetical protein